MSSDKPTCKVHGMIAPRAMCGYVIVGAKYCGFSGECQHKEIPIRAELEVAMASQAKETPP